MPISKVVVGEEEIQTNKGVPQGFKTSPILYNIATEELIEKMEE